MPPPTREGEHCGRAVAVRAVHYHRDMGLQGLIRRYCKEVVTWKLLRHPNILPLLGVAMSGNQLSTVSEWMINGTINEFVKAHPAADRLRLLEGVARGLTYIHDHGMLHGDLQGDHILIDQTGNARLAHFGPFADIPDPLGDFDSTPPSYPYRSIRWMGPELIDPMKLGLGHEGRRLTIASDCYAFGMVIYEVISGHYPFHLSSGYKVLCEKVLNGEHPPRGTSFTDSLWKTLEWCWELRPNARPIAKDVLHRLEMESYCPGPTEIDGCSSCAGCEPTDYRVPRV